MLLIRGTLSDLHTSAWFHNTKFLAASAELTGQFDTDAVKEELLRNCEEENGHAAMYKAALAKIGTDVETRETFESTENFLDTIGELCDDDPSAVLGTMFATETAAIFEHEVFRDVSVEVINRRESGDRGKSLVAFHDLHLGGVEQSHKDELGIFLRGLDPAGEVAPKDGDRPTIDPKLAMAGAEKAINAMRSWWDDLHARLRAMSEQPAAVVAG